MSRSDIGEHIPVQPELTRPDVTAAQQRGQAESPTANPEWVQQNIQAMSEPLEKSGIANDIEELSAQRLTAKEVADKLNLPTDSVRAVRAGRGIPSMDNKADFEQWLQTREAQPVSPVPQAPGESVSSPTAETPRPQGQPHEETGIAPGIEAAIAEIQRRNAPSEPVDTVPQTGRSQVPENSTLNPRESTGLSTTDNSVPTTGIAQRIHEQRMPGEVVPGEGLSAEALVDNGRKLISQGVDPNEIASMVLKDKRANADDVSVIRAKVEELSKATNKANDEWIANPDSPKARMAYDAAWQEEKRWRADILKPAQTEWSNVGRAMQGETAVDTGTFSGIRRAVLEDKGRDLKPEEIPKARKVVERVQKAQEAEARAKQAFDKAIERTAAKAPKSLDELKVHFAEKIRRLTPCP